MPSTRSLRACVRYADILSRLRTGDILLFHGASSRSRLIEAATGSEFSHVGMIVRFADEPPRLWHTDPRPVARDVEAGDAHGGAQLNDLGEALARMTAPEWGDTPSLRQLRATFDPGWDAAVRARIDQLERRPFPSLFGVLIEWLLGHLHIRTKGRRMYCGEVIAATYQELGLLASDPPANAYWPKDFSAKHEHLRWAREASLGPELELVDVPRAVEAPAIPA